MDYVPSAGALLSFVAGQYTPVLCFSPSRGVSAAQLDKYLTSRINTELHQGYTQSLLMPQLLRGQPAPMH